MPLVERAAERYESHFGPQRADGIGEPDDRDSGASALNENRAAKRDRRADDQPKLHPPSRHQRGAESSYQRDAPDNDPDAGRVGRSLSRENQCADADGSRKDEREQAWELLAAKWRPASPEGEKYDGRKPVAQCLPGCDWVVGKLGEGGERRSKHRDGSKGRGYSDRISRRLESASNPRVDPGRQRAVTSCHPCRRGLRTDRRGRSRAFVRHGRASPAVN